MAYFCKSILYLYWCHLVLSHSIDIRLDLFYSLLLFDFFWKPNRHYSHVNFKNRLIQIFDVFYYRSQHKHELIIKHDPAHKEIKIELRKIEFNAFLIHYSALKDVSYLIHKEEIGRFYLVFLIFCFSELPICHHIPHQISLPYRCLIQFLIIKINHLIKGKKFLRITQSINSKPVHTSHLDICKSIKRFHFNKDTVSCWEIDRNRDLSFTHQTHDLVTYWKVPYGSPFFYLSEKDAEDISEILCLTHSQFFSLQLPIVKIQSGTQ